MHNMNRTNFHNFSKTLGIFFIFHDFSRPGNNHLKIPMTFPGFPWPYKPCLPTIEHCSVSNVLRVSVWDMDLPENVSIHRRLSRGGVNTVLWNSKIALWINMPARNRWIANISIPGAFAAACSWPLDFIGAGQKGRTFSTTGGDNPRAIHALGVANLQCVRTLCHLFR